MAGELLGLYIGVVTDRKDPKGLGRVRVRVPGLLEPASAWAYPLGIGGGTRDRGLFFVPEEGAEVGLLFNQGDANHPYYLAAQWGKPGGESEVPSPARDAPTEQVPDVKVLETGNWRITMDDRPGTDSSLVIENKATGDKVEFDGSTAGITVEAKVALVLKAVGVVSIEGLKVQINGRTVRPGPDPI